MAAPVGKNYLSACKAFLKEFTATMNPNDPLPVKLTGYNIEDVDVEGEIIDWTLQYLNQKSCPQSLANTITQSVLNEMQTAVKEDHDLRVYTEDRNGVHYDPIKLMHAVIAKVNIVCDRLLREAESWDEKDGPCPQLPPPAPGPPFVSTYAIKNHRRRMEDRHVAIDDLHSLFNINLPGQVGYYAIFDGHNGHEAAAYSSAQLHGLIVHSQHYPKDPEAALREAFLRADEIFINKCTMSQKLMSGTTALVALLRPKKSLHVAWLGDSLGILVRSGGKVIQLVEPHTAERIDERKRIEDAGGVVIMHFSTWRINGTLSISRAIGDADCKPHVSAAADVVTHQLDGTEHFLVLACDGLWDSVTYQEAATFIYEQLRQDPANYSEIGKGLVNLAKNRASSDNISVVVVLLSTIEDILATAPPPVKEQPEALFSSDGLAPLCNPPHHYLVNGTMDGETAQFDSIHKVSSPEGAIDLTTRNGLHDIMMSSFYANGTEDSRDLFSNPCDLGPETDVDLLDDDVGGRAEQLQRDEAWCGGEKVVCPEETGSVQEKEDLEVVGGGVEEEEDDSEDEDAEWKYVSVKSPSSGVVPVSPEPSLEDKPADRQAPSGHEIDPQDLLEQSLEAGQQVVPEDSGFLEFFTSKESAKKQELDENKICPELDSEVVQKVELEENPNLIEDLSVEELQKQIAEANTFSEGSLQEDFIGESKESEEAAMESRLNPDAAEFVPISPTRIPDTLNSVGNEFDMFRKEAEALNSVGNEFDMFRKEAEACPGEVCDEMSSIPTEIVGRPIINDDLLKNPFDRSDLADSDVVLSSSFNYEQRNLEVMDYLGSAEESAVQGSYNFAEEDEDKENIPVCDDKENMRLSPNTELVSVEEVALITQERELERLEETIFENVSGTSEAPGLQIADSSSLDVLKERVEFDQGFPESEQQSELTESPNLMVDDHDQRMQSPEIPQAVEQTYVLESKIPQEEEELVQLDEKVRSPEPVVATPEPVVATPEPVVATPEPLEATPEPVTETKSSIEEPVEVHQSLGNLDFHEVEQDLIGVNESHEKLDEQGMKQDLIVSEQDPVNVGVQIIEDSLVQANENQKENLAHAFDDFEIIQTPEKVEENSIENVSSQEIENDLKDFHQSHEKLSHEVKEEIGKIHEAGEFHDFTQKASEDSYSPENIASEVLNVSSNPEQMILDEHIIDSSKEIMKFETEIEFETAIKEDIQVADHELLSEIDQQMSNLSVNDQQHVTEKYQEDVELSHTEQVETCVPADEEREQRPTFQMEDNFDDMLQTHLKEEKIHNEGEQYQIEIEQEFQVKSSEDVNSESLIDISTKNIVAEVEIIPSPVLQTDLEKVSSSEQLLSPSPVPETIPVLETCPESLVTKSPTPGAELSSEIQIPSPIVEQVTPPVQEDIPKLDLSVALGHEAVTPKYENIIPSVSVSAAEPEFEVKEVSEVKDEQVTAEVSPVVQSPSEAASQTAVLEQAIEEKIEKESAETPKIAEVIPSLPLDAKLSAKKTPSADKKKTPEKSKAPAAASSKGKVAARSSVPPSRTNLTAAKTSATSPTKSSGTKPTPTERKTAPPAAGKPTAPSKSTTAPLSSKPRTSMTKPSPVPTTKSAPPLKSSNTASRPGTASSKPASASALSKPASATGTTKPVSASRPSSASTTLKSSSATSKPASATAKSTITQSKVTEVKRAVNGDASKSLSHNTSAPPKPAPRKVPLSSTAAASKTGPSLTKTSAKPLSTAVKAASESTKPKSQTVVNGTASKPSRPVNSTSPKPPTSLSAQARKPLSKTSTSSVNDPKKAKESANKHISATRTSVGSPAARRSTDLKGSLASKTAAAKGRPSEPKAPLSNGTVTEKTSETIKEVKGKIDLMIKENGVEIENDVRKEEEIAVQELCTVKEQVMLIVEEGVREAM